MSDFILNFIHLCDEAIFSREGKLSLIGIFDVVNLVNLPGSLVKAVLICNFTVFNQKINAIKLNISITKEGERIPIFTLPPVNINIVRKQNHSTNIKDGENKIGMSLQLTNLPFKSEGTYFINVSANEELLGHYKFNVKKIETKKQVN